MQQLLRTPATERAMSTTLTVIAIICVVLALLGWAIVKVGGDADDWEGWY